MTTHEPPTRLTLGPQDDGRAVSADEFAEAFYLEPWRFERVDGRLVVMPPDGKDHVLTATPWLDRLIIYKINHPDRVQVVVPNSWVRVHGGTDRIGDIGVFLAGDPLTLNIPDQAPDLMFEVVSREAKDRRRDYVDKRAEYHRVGVREYVIVDRFQQRVTVLTHAPGGYQERILTPADTYTSPLLPGLAIALAEVLGP